MMNEGMLRIEKPGRLYALITSSTAARNAASTRRAGNRALAHYVHNSAVARARRLCGAAASVPPREESEASAPIRCGAKQAVGAADGLPTGQGIRVPPPAAMSGRMSWSIERQRSSIAARATPSSNSSSSFSYDSTDSGRPNRPVLCDAMQCGATPRRRATPPPYRRSFLAQQRQRSTAGVGIAQGRARTSTFGGNGFCVCACKPLVALRTESTEAVCHAHCAAAQRVCKQELRCSG